MWNNFLDSITQVTPEASGKVLLAASHGGLYCASYIARAALRGAILHDAGVGRDQAGIAGLLQLDRWQVPAATISHWSARIGDGGDCLRRGVISFANETARRAGVVIGQRAADALIALDEHAPAASAPVIATTESRRLIMKVGDISVLALDSNSLVTAEDAHAIVMSGSHGGLLGGRPETAVKYPVLAAAYNDADIGIDAAGVARLAALDARGICAFTVSAWSACIGDGSSTYEEGFVTRVNALAQRYGAEPGLAARQVVARLLDAFQSRTPL
jgi:hypothetical protein